MLYINARSLLPNVDELLVLASVDKPKIICITESWMCHDNISDEEISIPGFQLFRRDRNRHGGGVLMYVSDALQCKRLNVRSCEDLEILSIIVHNEHSRLGISMFYQPPRANSTNDLLTSLALYLERIDLCQFANFMLLHAPG